jgi:hypothetical protein
MRSASTSAAIEVGRDEVPGRVEIEAQHPAAGVDEDLLRRAVRAHAQDVAAEHRGVELAVLADGDVLGADLAAQVARKLFVTTALPYANGNFHIGHIMEYIQADIWVRTSACRATR